MYVCSPVNIVQSKLLTFYESFLIEKGKRTSVYIRTDII